MRFLLIGTGFIMPRHVEAIYRVGGKLVDLVNTAHGEDTWREVILRTKASHVIIATPNDLHFPMAMAAAEAGKVVLCEKPLALTSNDVRLLATKPNIFTVLQLRHHPLAKKLRSEINHRERYDVEMDISNYRDDRYYRSWKADTRRSGGILFNLGSHYFDMLIHLFGYPTEIVETAGNDRTMHGTLRGERYTCRWRVSSEAKQGEQHRTYTINGVNCNFSSRENLSQEQLHADVYRDLMEGRGVTPADALYSTRLIETIYKRVPLTSHVQPPITSTA